MNYSGKIMKAIVVGISLLCGLTVVTKNAMSATAPLVSNLTAVVDGTSTPVQILTDPTGNLGNFYVSDPRGSGVLQYDRNGKLLKKYTAVSDAVGMAFSPNFATSNELLVTHGTTVVRLNVTTGNIMGTFGTFIKAHGIAVDGTGNIYVTDSEDDCVQKFDSSFNPVTVAVHNSAKPVNSFGTTGLLATLNTAPQFKRPAGITFEKVSGQLAVADSLNGRISFVSQTGLLQSVLGKFGPPASPGLAPKFTMPKNIAFEYTAGPTASRFYVVDSFQDNVQVIDAATRLVLSINDIGGYGYDPGKLVSPSDVQIDQTNPLAPVLLVANEIGLVTRYGIDSLQPTNLQVLSPTVPRQLTLTWTNPAISSFSALHIYQSPTSGITGTQIGGTIPAAATTYTDTSLTAGNTYYYTVRGVDALGNEDGNTNQVSGTTLQYYQLNINLVGYGAGSGTLSGPGLTYSTTVPYPPVNPTTTTTGYVAQVNSGASVTLIPNNAQKTYFAGWTGDVCNNQLTGNCVFTMNSNVNVIAAFNQQFNFMIAGSGTTTGDHGNDNLQAIYDLAKDGDTIMATTGISPVTSVSFPAMTAGAATNIKIIGGYDSEYKAVSSFTTLQGRINLKAGKVAFKNIKIKP
jgi:hypothetical protein